MLYLLLQATTPGAYPNNAAYVKEYASNLLITSFPNMVPEQVQAAVVGMMELEDKRAFKHHMRDFLVQTKAFGSKESAELYAEETALKLEEQRKKLSHIPGMVPPSQQVNDDMADG